MSSFIKRKIKEFKDNQLGNVVIIAATAAPVLIFSAGSAVDFVRFQEAKQIARRALDGATLAAATDLSQKRVTREEAKTRAQSFFTINVSDLGLSADQITLDDEIKSDQPPGPSVESSDGPAGPNLSGFEFIFDEDNATVTATVDIEVPTFFSQIFGIEKLETLLSSTAAYGGAPGARNNIEFSFVLDVTGSMSRNGRIQTLRSSLASTINTLLPEDGRNKDRIRVGLVPYAYSVNLGEEFHQAAVGPNTRSGNGFLNCVTEREGANEDADIAPNIAIPNTLYETDIVLNALSSRLACPSVRIRPLTNDRVALLADAASLQASGFTGGHMGITWGLNLLSEKWQGFWPEGSKPDAYPGRLSDREITSTNPDDLPTRKVLVIMTDGVFNTSFLDRDINPNRSLRSRLNTARRQTTASRREALGFCDLAKRAEAGVEVYTIAFQAPNSAIDLLQACATPDDPNAIDLTARGPHFFNATQSEDLIAAFNNIIARELKVLLIN